MLNDGQHRAIGVFIAGMTALRPVAGVIERVKVTTQTRHRGEHTDADPRLVHHVEHVFEAFVFLSNEVAKAITTLAKIEQRVGSAALPHLVIEAGERNVVGFTQRTILLDTDFGYQKQRDALYSRRCVRSSSQHHVHNVLGNILLAAGDPHLGTSQLVTAVTNGLGKTADIRQ